MYLGESGESATLFTLNAEPTLGSKVIKAQRGDCDVDSIRVKISNRNEEKGLNVHSDLSVRYLDRLFVPESCREEVLREFHHSRLAVHPGGTKMYHDLSRQFWWRGMKWDVALFVSKMPYLSTSEGRTPKTSGVVTTLTDSRVEVGACYHGFCSWAS